MPLCQSNSEPRQNQPPPIEVCPGLRRARLLWSNGPDETGVLRALAVAAARLRETLRTRSG
ncbi:hypothetical protein PCAR4_860094 [Paraburkholderia caribensis]|nr:hypothetical protein PCAR4_860094 [Paraburkholderia caribensis]